MTRSILPAKSTKFFSIAVSGRENEAEAALAAPETNNEKDSTYICFRLLFSNLQNYFIPFCFRVNRKEPLLDVRNSEGQSVRNSLLVLRIEKDGSGQYGVSGASSLQVGMKKENHAQIANLSGKPIRVLVLSTCVYFRLQSQDGRCYGSYGSSPAVIDAHSTLLLSFDLIVEMYLDRIKHNALVNDEHLIEFQDEASKQRQQIILQITNA